MATQLVSNFVNILNNEFDKEEVFFQLEDTINNLEKVDDEDVIGYELEDIIDHLTNEDAWEVEADLGISATEVMESAHLEGWTSGKTPVSPKVYVLTHNEDLISDRVYAIVVTEANTNDIHAVCFQLD
jgi:hypothetical protein